MTKRGAKRTRRFAPEVIYFRLSSGNQGNGDTFLQRGPVFRENQIDRCRSRLLSRSLYPSDTPVRPQIFSSRTISPRYRLDTVSFPMNARERNDTGFIKVDEIVTRGTRAREIIFTAAAKPTRA